MKGVRASEFTQSPPVAVRGLGLKIPESVAVRHVPPPDSGINSMEAIFLKVSDVSILAFKITAASPDSFKDMLAGFVVCKQLLRCQYLRRRNVLTIVVIRAQDTNAVFLVTLVAFHYDYACVHHKW